MSDPARINALLLQWQDLRARGTPVSSAELCRDCPELRGELDRRIKALLAATPAPRDSAARIDLVLGAAPQLADQVAAILRPNLRWAGLVFVVWWISGMLLLVLDGGFGLGAADYVAVTADVLMQGVLVALLWSRRPLSLRALRAIEVGIFGLNALALAWTDYRFLQGGWLSSAAGRLDFDQHLASKYADSLAISWFALMITYGTYVPNGWKRCAVMEALFALSPVLTAGVFGLTGGSPEQVALAALPGLVFWLTTAAALGVYAAHKISTIRGEAFEARKLGQYQLRRRLGAGGMGEVFLAEHQLLRRPCALKLIRPEKAGDARNLLRFEREVRTLATLTHPNVVSVFDYGHASDGTFYFVMEYLAGLNLEEIVERAGVMPPERVVHLLRQVCGALAEAHACGLIHRDVKPTNVIVCERGKVPDVAKLVDFGMVQETYGDEACRLTQEKAIVGTPAFMAPEQIAGADDLDARTDLYSLGAVAYYLLTGRCPFERKNVPQLFAAHLNEPVVAPTHWDPALPADVEAVVLRCLEKKRDDRFADAAALEQALAACACAGRWDLQDASAWWRQHETTGSTA